MNYTKLSSQAAEVKKLAQQMKKLADRLAAIESKYNQTGELTDAEYELANFTGDLQLQALCRQLREQIPNF